MATGYTCRIEKGISFEDFVLQCARAFGALIEMRDESLEAPIRLRTISDYHAKAIERAKAELFDLERISLDKVQVQMETEYQNACKERDRILAEKKQLRKKYDAMLAKVEAWKPPTKAHGGLKSFMLQQIKESINWDCDESYWKDHPVRQSAEEWLKNAIEQAKRDLDYHEREAAREKKMTEESNDWIIQLCNSLGVPAPQ